MSTVVLTPTHMACDHNVVRNTFPHQTKAEIDHKKIFVAPNKLLAIGTVGEYLPEEIDHEKTWEALAGIMVLVAAQQAIDGLTENSAYIPDSQALERFKSVFDPDARTFIVSKTHRFVVFYSKLFDHWMAKEVGPYAGIGSGGNIATGLLLGKMPLPDIWRHLHRLDHLSSAEFTTLPLSILKPATKFINRLKKVREEKA